jgi:hypothetical protein
LGLLLWRFGLLGVEHVLGLLLEPAAVGVAATDAAACTLVLWATVPAWLDASQLVVPATEAAACTIMLFATVPAWLFASQWSDETLWNWGKLLFVARRL